MRSSRTEAPDDRFWPRLAGLWLVSIFALSPCLMATSIEFDDPAYWKKNPAVYAPDGLARIWTSREMPKDATNWPMVFTSYWIEQRLWGGGDFGAHLVNVGLHLVGASLALVWLGRLAIPATLAFSAALLFAVHPINAGSVAWITERKNVLSGVFFFASLAAFAQYRRVGLRRDYGMYLLWTLAALLSKSSTVCLPLIAGLTDVLFFPSASRLASVKRQAAPILLVVVCSLWTLHAERNAVELSWLDRATVACVTPIFYICKWICPLGLRLFYPPWDLSALRWQAAVSAMVVGVGLLGLSWAWRKIPPAVLLGLGCYGLALAPVAGWAPFGWFQFAFVANHLAYLPSIGLALISAWLLECVPASARKGALFGVLAPTLALTFAECRRWQDSAARFAEIDPNHAVGSVLTTKATWLYTDPGRDEETRALLETMIRRFPDSPAGHTRLAALDIRQGKFDAAFARLEHALRLDGGFADALVMKGDALLSLGRLEEAEGVFRKLVALRNAGDDHTSLGAVLSFAGRSDEAMVSLEKAVALDPDNSRALLNLGVELVRRGQVDAGLARVRRAVVVDPDNPKARATLQTLLGRQSELGK